MVEGILTAADVAELMTQTRAISRTLKPLFEEEGLREDTWRVLQVLEGERGMPMISIANRLHLSPATISRLTDDLDNEGLVFRRPAPEDARKINVYLSREGAQRLRRLSEAIGTRLAKSLAVPTQ